ncbi:MAG: DUF2071 domain-containing protein, partial [Bacteroidota bacterium]
CLRLDTFQDTWAFIAVALVQTEDLRPRGFPRWMGIDFFLIGYRIFVRFTTQEGKRLRGLYILKSETNKRRMEVLGNIFTHYQYTTTDIQQSENTIQSTRSGFNIRTDETDSVVSLPEGSPFKDWKEARRFAGPLPHTFSWLKEPNQVLIIRGIRQSWKPQPVNISEYQISFLEQLNLPNIRLASAFEIRNIPYHWEKGKLAPWKQQDLPF